MTERLSPSERQPSKYLDGLKVLSAVEIVKVKTRIEALIQGDLEDGSISERPTTSEQKWSYLENAVGWENPEIQRAFGKAKQFDGATAEDIRNTIKKIIPNFETLLLQQD